MMQRRDSFLWAAATVFRPMIHPSNLLAESRAWRRGNGVHYKSSGVDVPRHPSRPGGFAPTGRGPGLAEADERLAGAIREYFL